MNPNPSFEDQSSSQVPSREPIASQVQQPTEGTTPEREESTPQPQVPPVSEQPQTPEIPEADNPRKFIQDNTPGNPATSQEPEGEIAQEILPQAPVTNSQEVEPQQPVTNSKVEKEKNQEGLEKELNSVKELLLALLEGRKIRDLSEYPRDLLNPEITSYSGREMIKPFGIQTVRFGYVEFKKALDNAMALDENTYILKYLSKRPREDGSQPEPRLLKCTKEQVDMWKTKIERKKQQTQIGGQQYQQPPVAEQF